LNARGGKKSQTGGGGLIGTGIRLSKRKEEISVGGRRDAVKEREGSKGRSVLRQEERGEFIIWKALEAV